MPYRIRAVVASLAIAIAGTLPVVAAESTLPAWYARELATLTRDSGRWIADNRAFENTNEPYDAYGVEWRGTADGRGLTGRLFGLQDGREVGEFWQYRIHWDAKEQRAIVQQFASFGVIGIGTFAGFDRDGRPGTLMEQTFTAPDGRQWRELHESWFESGVHVTRSHDWRDGGWSAKRTYRWMLQPGPAEQATPSRAAP
jgi:hypothetical protein